MTWAEHMGEINNGIAGANYRLAIPKGQPPIPDSPHRRTYNHAGGECRSRVAPSTPR
jgi:hypothetical protein